MLDRMSLGEIPRKHHIAFRSPEGKLRWEHCITRDGFDGAYTISYHLNEPHTQRVIPVNARFALPKAAEPQPLAKRHYLSQHLGPKGGTPLASRIPVLFNDDVTLSILFPNQEDTVYFANGDADELFYIHQGTGLVRTLLGDLRYSAQDYVMIPRGILYRIIPDSGSEQYWLNMAFSGGIHLPRQWRNDVGQLKMEAPFCHRDFQRPVLPGPLDEGIRELIVQKNNAFHGFAYQNSPLDVVGWDGAVYPWIFPILNFQPRAGLVHLPPTWHGTFAARGALVCSFVPRTVDFHPEAIPCPYPHSSVDCDEFIFYCHGNFTSRRGVGPGSISFHPAGIPHGPHPGAYEGSIGHKTTGELAVMLDTVKPLQPTPWARDVEDPNYMESFLPR